MGVAVFSVKQPPPEMKISGYSGRQPNEKHCQSGGLRKFEGQK